MSKELESLRQAKPDIRFEHFQIESLGDVSLAMEQIGRIVGKPKPAAAARERFAAALAAVRRAADGLPRPRVLFAIGYERPFVAGKDTFVGEMIELAGGVNAGDPGRPHQRWRGADIEEIMAARPDVLVCQAAPGREDQTREYWLRVPGLPAAETARVHVVTDPRWTIPSTYSAVLAEQLLEMVHPGPAGGGPR
jgi:iron complex transport system substrate-binding protein